MKRQILITAAALTFILAAGAIAQQDMDMSTEAQRPAGQMMGQGMMGGMNTMMSPLNRIIQTEWELYLRHRGELALTEYQVEELQDIRIEYLRETNDVRGELEIATQELEDMLTGDEYNVNEAGRKISDVHDLVVEIEVAQVSYAAEARELLTGTQREQARELRSQGRRRMMMDGSGMMDGQMMRGRMR